MLAIPGYTLFFINVGKLCRNETQSSDQMPDSGGHLAERKVPRKNCLLFAVLLLGSAFLYRFTCHLPERKSLGSIRTAQRCQRRAVQ